MKLVRQFVRKILLEKYPRNVPVDLTAVLPDNLEIQKSPIHGVGVFATENIPADTDLGPAQILTPVGSYDVTKLGRYHNHSYQPSCYNDWDNEERHLYSARDLEPGDEITVDYTRQSDLEQPDSEWK